MGCDRWCTLMDGELSNLFFVLALNFFEIPTRRDSAAHTYSACVKTSTPVYNQGLTGEAAVAMSESSGGIVYSRVQTAKPDFSCFEVLQMNGDTRTNKNLLHDYLHHNFPLRTKLPEDNLAHKANHTSSHLPVNHANRSCKCTNELLKPSFRFCFVRLSLHSSARDT